MLVSAWQGVIDALQDRLEFDELDFAMIDMLRG